MKSTSRILIWIIFIFSILLFISCEEKPEVLYTISGYLYEDCNMVPISNQELELIQDIDNGGLNPESGYQSTAITDSNGYFYFEFKNIASGDEIIRYMAGAGYNTLIEGIPQQINIADLILYQTPTCNIQVNLNVINPHGVGDTLIIGDYRTLNNLEVPCPIYSGLLYTADSFPLLTMYYNGEKKFINWYFTPYDDNDVIQEFTIDEYCNDTVFVTVDIY